MRRALPAALGVVALALLAAAPAAALTVTITGPGTVWVPYGQCTTATWTASITNGTASTYEWAYDGSLAGTTKSVSRTFCSPNLEYAITENHDWEVWVTGGGEAGYDSHHFGVVFEAGDENGGCGFQRICN